eukprot:23503_1
MDTVKEDGVISAIWEFNENKNKKKIKTLIQKSKYLVVDLLDDGENNNQYPLKFKQTDICGMFDIDASPKEHLQYAKKLAMTGAICCGLSYALVKRPSMLKRFGNASVKPVLF